MSHPGDSDKHREQASAVSLRVGSFRYRRDHQSLSENRVEGLVFDASAVPEAAQLGDWICHMSANVRTVRGVRFPLWICSHVETGTAMNMTADTNPWGAMARLFFYLGDKGEQIEQAIEQYRKDMGLAGESSPTDCSDERGSEGGEG